MHTILPPLFPSVHLVGFSHESFSDGFVVFGDDFSQANFKQVLTLFRIKSVRLNLWALEIVCQYSEQIGSDQVVNVLPSLLLSQWKFVKVEVFIEISDD